MDSLKKISRFLVEPGKQAQNRPRFNSAFRFTCLVTYPNNWHLKKVIEHIPLNKIVIETDAPYFLPKGGCPGEETLGHSGHFSVPVYAANIAAQIASIKKCRIKTVLKANCENIKRVYGL